MEIGTKVHFNKGRQQAYAAINQAMVQTYWQIGQRIVEEEQQGKERAEYGKQLLIQLSEAFTKEFGRGFSTQNLYYFRQFYLTYPEIFHTPCGILTWSHYRRLHHHLSVFQPLRPSAHPPIRLTHPSLRGKAWMGLS